MDFQLKRLGTTCWLAQFGPPSVELFKYLTALRFYLLNEISCSSIVQSYNSIAIYDGSIEIIKSKLDSFVFSAMKDRSRKYKLQFKPCLEINSFAKSKNASVREIINLYTENEYMVAAIGFIPNFPYLWGLHEALYFPRIDRPRMTGVEGAIGIGGNQTGIYPQNSMSGWTLIGTTNPEICERLNIGDTIGFQV